MDKVVKVLDIWQLSLCKKIELAALFFRNPTAHKWKATYRSNVIRELTFWRATDLLSQMVVLFNAGHVLGARILLRSAIETLSVLIYLNEKTKAVLVGGETFSAFKDITHRLMLGSRNNTTTGVRDAAEEDEDIKPINVGKLIKMSDNKYPGISDIYADLCESAHPNNEGLRIGYSYVNEETYETVFENRWAELYSDGVEELTLAVMKVFTEEYDTVWPAEFEKLEQWLVNNDQQLESERSKNNSS